MIGDLDPIKAARASLQLSDELTMHYGLLPRANRGIFAINELPDLAGKIQVGLFNILQEGDVQIKGYPVRLRLDLLLVFSANPEDYTARGKIITPLKDRIGSEIRTHYPATRQHAMAITAQEAWLQRGNSAIEIPEFVREVVEEVAFQARQDSKIDKRSGVSQRLSISSARERRLERREARAPAPTSPWWCRASPISMRHCRRSPASSSWNTKGNCAEPTTSRRDVIRNAVSNVFGGYFGSADLRQVTEWFDLGGTLQIDDALDARSLLTRAADVQGLKDLDTSRRRAAECRTAIDGGRRRLRARRALRAEEDQPRSDEFQLSIEWGTAAPAGASNRTGIDRTGSADARGKEEVLQLRLRTRAQGSRRQRARASLSREP